MPIEARGVKKRGRVNIVIKKKTRGDLKRTISIWREGVFRETINQFRVFQRRRRTDRDGDLERDLSSQVSFYIKLVMKLTNSNTNMCFLYKHVNIYIYMYIYMRLLRSFRYVKILILTDCLITRVCCSMASPDYVEKQS